VITFLALLYAQRSNYYPIDGTTGQQISPINKKVYSFLYHMNIVCTMLCVCLYSYVLFGQFTQLLHEFAAECSHPMQNAFNKIIDVCKQGQVVVVCTVYAVFLIHVFVTQKDHILQEFGACCHKLTLFIDRMVPYHLLRYCNMSLLVCLHFARCGTIC